VFGFDNPGENAAIVAFSPTIAKSITLGSTAGVEAVGGSHFKIKENYSDEDLPVSARISRSFGSKPHKLIRPATYQFTQQKNQAGNEMHQVVAKMTENGPANIVNTDQSRVWLESYYDLGRTKSMQTVAGTVSGYKDNNFGSMLGAQIGSKEKGWIVGMLVGLSSGKGVLNNDSRNRWTLKHKFVSLFHRMNFANGFEYNIIGQCRKYDQNISRLTPRQQIAKGPLKAKSYYLNGEVSYKIPLNNQISVRPNLGISAMNEKSKAFDETEAGNENLHWGATNIKNREVYAGIGVRNEWQEQTDASPRVYKLTATYEMGHELAYRGTTYPVKVISTGATSTIKVPSTGNIANYLTLYGSVQQDQLKFVANYTATIKKARVLNHFSLKAEWRF
jgi:hypothetical protein